MNLFRPAREVTVQQARCLVAVPGVVGDQHGRGDEVEFRVGTYQFLVFGPVPVGVLPRADDPPAERATIAPSGGRDFERFDRGPVEGIGELLPPCPMRFDNGLEGERGRRLLLGVARIGAAMVMASISPGRGEDIEVLPAAVAIWTTPNRFGASPFSF